MTVSTISAPGSLDHPVQTARLANRLEQLGRYRMAWTLRYALAANDRCCLCGRRLTSWRTRHDVIGRGCRARVS